MMHQNKTVPIAAILAECAKIDTHFEQTGADQEHRLVALIEYYCIIHSYRKGINRGDEVEFLA